MQKTNLTDYEKINASLLKITCIFWLLAKVIGWRMWTTYRSFPTAPVFDSFDQIPSVTHTILFILSLLFIVLLFVFNKNRPLLFGLLIVEICTCLFDQNRWQPWEYQYIFIIFIFIVNIRDQKRVTIALTFILAATYFYSGLGKLNPGFLQTIWTKMILESFLKVPVHIATQHWLHYSGYLVGFTELIAGIGLLFSKTQKVSAGVLIAMHLFILVFIGPIGLKYNKIVWPWNAAMILYLYAVFLRKEQIDITFKSIFNGWNKMVFVCWGLLPALNFFGCWDNYLSSNIYSGRLPRMVICIKDTSKCRELQRFCRKGNPNLCDGGSIIDIQYWAMSETKVAPYPEIRVYKKMQKKLEKKFAVSGISCVYIVNGRAQ